VVAVLCALALAGPAAAADDLEEQVQSPFGTLHLVRPRDPAAGLVIYLPGARGWDAEAAATAREAAGEGHLVAALDWSAAQRNQTAAQAGQPPACWDLGEKMVRLADWVDEREGLSKDALPTLLGEDEGAALVYAAQLQSPEHRFHAAVTVGFCPRWPAAALPPCRIEALTDALIQGDRLLPADRVPNAWFLFPSATGACPAAEFAAFAERVSNARVATGAPGPAPVPAPGENLTPLGSLMQWLDPRIPDQVSVVASEKDIAGLPLVEVRAPNEDPHTFAVMLSGDGGWAALDRGISAELARKGISTVGWDSLGYFWKPRTPAQAAHDLTRVLRHYLDAWHKERVILIGYSFGADALPFMANALPDDLRPKIGLAAFLGLGRTAAFEFHLSDWIGAERGTDAPRVFPQVEALTWTRNLCVYGADEEDSLCPELTRVGTRVHKVAGDHHFDGDYPGVADLIVAGAGK
jgi:type IV secretory pathway VirJ component